jgi:hypothetical protein
MSAFPRIGSRRGGTVRSASAGPGSTWRLAIACGVLAGMTGRTDCGYRAAKPFFIRLFSGLARPRASILGTEFEAYRYVETGQKIGNVMITVEKGRHYPASRRRESAV